MIPSGQETVWFWQEEGLWVRVKSFRIRLVFTIFVRTFGLKVKVLEDQGDLSV